MLTFTRICIRNTLYAKVLCHIYICPQTLYMWYKKVTTCILHDTPCHLVKISYLVYCTVISGHPPQDVDILWIISVSNVFCLLLVRPLSMSSKYIRKWGTHEWRLCLHCWVIWVWTQNVVNTSASNIDFSYLPRRYRVHNN